VSETYREAMILSEAEAAAEGYSMPEWRLKQARKLHICIACGKAIRPFSKYFGQFAWPPFPKAEPPWLPVRFHEDCQDRKIEAVPRYSLPAETLLDMKTGDVFEGNMLPTDWVEVGWSRKTASSAYFYYEATDL